MRKAVFPVILAVLSLAGGFFVMHVIGVPRAQASGCTIYPMWTWTDGSDYTTPPGPLNTNQTIQVKVKFTNCNGYSVQSIVTEPGALFGTNQVTVNWQTVNSDNMDQTWSLTPTIHGQYSYVTTANGGGGTFSAQSSVVTVQNAFCTVTVNLSASPTTVSSVSQDITLTATLTADTNTCLGMNPLVIVNFLANENSINSQTQALPRGVAKAVNFQTTAASVGVTSGGQISFSAKVTSAGENAVNTAISTPVNVGVEVPPGPLSGNGNGSNSNGNGNGSNSNGNGGGTSAQSSQGLALPNPLTGCGDLTCVVTDVINFLFTLAIPIFGIMILVGGFQMLTAAGNPEKFSSGEKTLLYSVIGFVVILLAGSVATLIRNIFTGS